MCVLVLEDEPGIRELLAEMLDEEGWPVCRVGSVTEARLRLEIPGTRILIADRDLGAGQDGHQFASDARARYPGLAIVYMTGTPKHLNGRVLRDREWALPKPFLPSKLTEMVRVALQS